jgi:hypothetical protein
MGAKKIWNANTKENCRNCGVSVHYEKGTMQQMVV